MAWQNLNLEEQFLTVRRSVSYNGATHKHENGSTKRKKVRIVDFENALASRIHSGSIWLWKYYLQELSDKTGLEVVCVVDEKTYLTGIKISEEQKDNINIEFLGPNEKWNYIIRPRKA